MAAEDRADLADDARLVVVADDEQRAFERRLDLDAVEQRRAAALPGSNTVPSIQRSPSLVCSLIDSRLAKSRGRELLRLDDLDAALFGDRRGR